ncbi:beta-galactoside alpha-2,6-sialyltransferase 2-like [Ptychodera flava]|uniref:beta-galactoside alpha-2,6-sialyltransferase 2-like n=1 Tax=Ptychodera flava TaxID=63121 RepID=UPI003969EF18
MFSNTAFRYMPYVLLWTVVSGALLYYYLTFSGAFRVPHILLTRANSTSGRTAATTQTPAHANRSLMTTVNVSSVVTQMAKTLPNHTVTSAVNFSAAVEFLPDMEGKNISAIFLGYDHKFDNSAIAKKNPYGIRYKGKKRKGGKPQEILCALKKNIIKFLDPDASPYKEIGLGRYITNLTLADVFPDLFNSCAIVASSNFLVNSSLGQVIDKNHAVFRFNSAPLKGYEKDVGTRTTVRIINTPVLGRVKSKNYTNSMFHQGVFFLWRTGPYNGNLYRWFMDRSAANFFKSYMQWQETYPDVHKFLVNPGSLWRQWDTVQGFTPKNLKKIGVSSGFVGLVIALQVCREVNYYGYVTPKGKVYGCHYYDKPNSKSCNSTFHFHPLAQEKALVMSLDVRAQNKSITGEDGIVTVPGFSTITCKGDRTATKRH